MLRYAPPSKPDWNPQTEFDTRPIDNIDSQQLSVVNSHQSSIISEQERFAFLQLANISEHPGCLDFCLKSIPIKPWPHQIKILRRVAEKFPQSFLIADEVGLGKTIETGLILRYLRILLIKGITIQLLFTQTCLTKCHRCD